MYDELLYFFSTIQKKMWWDERRHHFKVPGHNISLLSWLRVFDDDDEEKTNVTIRRFGVWDDVDNNVGKRQEKKMMQ